MSKKNNTTLDYKLEKFRGKEGYWVRQHHFLELTEIPRHIVIDALKDKKALRKTFYKKNEKNKKQVLFFIITSKPVYTPESIKSFILKKRVDSYIENGLEVFKSVDKDDNGNNGYWLDLKHYAEYLDIKVTELKKRYSYISEDEYPEEVQIRGEGDDREFFFCIDPEPYTRDEAIAKQNSLRIVDLGAKKVSVTDMPTWKEIKRLDTILKKNPNAIGFLEKLSVEDEESIKMLFDMGGKFKQLFE